MKKRNIVLLIILIILVSAGLLAYHYSDYLSIFYHVATDGGEKLAVEKEETDKQAIETIKEFGITEVRPLTEEETEKLNKGEITEEEAVKIVLGQMESNEAPPKENNSAANTDTGENVNSDVEEKPVNKDLEKKNKEIAELIGQIYVLKAKYTGELNAVEQWAKSEYIKLTPEEKKNKANKIKIGRKAYTRACDLEAECDQQMENIFSRLEILLKETGQGTSLLDNIRKAYESEKKVKMSYYMDKVM